MLNASYRRPCLNPMRQGVFSFVNLIFSQRDREVLNFGVVLVSQSSLSGHEACGIGMCAANQEVGNDKIP